MNNTMSYKGYIASMIFDAEDKIIVGRVLDVDDIITFHGESVSEFEINFHAAVDDYRSACEQLGSAPEKPTLKAAARSGVSLNKWAERAISSATRRPAGQRRSRGQTRT